MPSIRVEKMPSQDQSTPATKAANEKRKHENEVLDEALEETFPASDPVAVSMTHIVTTKK
jgi:hypothetical protein